MNRTRTVLALLAVLCLVGGVGLVAYARNDGSPDGVLLGDDLRLTPAMEVWVYSLKTQEGVFVKVFGGYRLVLIARGEKPSGGYGVTIEDVTHLLEIYPPVDWTVFVKFVNPSPGDMVTQAITYPYAALAIKDDGIEIQVFKVAGGDHVELPVTIVD